MITPPGRHMQRHAVDPAQYRVDLHAVCAKAPALDGGKNTSRLRTTAGRQRPLSSSGTSVIPSL